MRLDSMLFIRCLIDCALAVWFFLPIPREGPALSYVRAAAAGLCLLAMLPIYLFIDLLPLNLARLIYRVGLYLLYLRFSKQLSWARCLYFALIGWLTFNICSNIFLTPLLRPIYFVSTLSQVTFQLLLAYLFYFGVLTLVSRGIPFAQIQTPGASRFAFVSFLCAAQLYIKSTLNYISGDGYSGPTELSAYLILLQVLLAAALVFFERYLDSRRLQEEERLASVASNYRYESAMAQQAAEDDLRRVHHDMKNHLLVIQGLAQDNNRLNSYIGSLMDDLSTYDLCADTGNSLLNGLLSNKLRRARQKEVACSVAVDFRPCAYMEDKDICTIFGNILDNAIEASARIPDPQERSILLKSTPAAGQLIITCSNRYTGELRLSGGLPQTTKADRKNHGIGLSSVRRSVEKYGGVLSLRTTQDQWLDLTILLPLQEDGSGRP